MPGIAAATSTYDGNDRTVGDSWNDNGNMLTRDGRTQTFDSLDRLMSSAPTSGTTVKVTYDGDGNRVAQDVGGVVSTYLVDDQNPTGYAQVVEERVAGAVTKSYVYGLKPIAQKAKTGSTWTTNHYGLDGHGSVVLLTDSTGAITDTWEYDAFGTLVARTGTTSNSILYSGEWMDAEQGIQYLRARWYGPGLGRFVSADTVETGDGFFRYTGNNPVMRVDPSGHMTLGETMAVVTIVAAITFSATNSSTLGYRRDASAQDIHVNLINRSAAPDAINATSIDEMVARVLAKVGDGKIGTLTITSHGCAGCEPYYVCAGPDVYTDARGQSHCVAKFDVATFASVEPALRLLRKRFAPTGRVDWLACGLGAHPDLMNMMAAAMGTRVRAPHGLFWFTPTDPTHTASIRDEYFYECDGSAACGRPCGDSKLSCEW